MPVDSEYKIKHCMEVVDRIANDDSVSKNIRRSADEIKKIVNKKEGSPAYRAVLIRRILDDIDNENLPSRITLQIYPLALELGTIIYPDDNIEVENNSELEKQTINESQNIPPIGEPLKRRRSATVFEVCWAIFSFILVLGMICAIFLFIPIIGQILGFLMFVGLLLGIVKHILVSDFKIEESD